MDELIHISVSAVYCDHQTHECERQTASQSKGHSDKQALYHMSYVDIKTNQK